MISYLRKWRIVRSIAQKCVLQMSKRVGTANKDLTRLFIKQNEHYYGNLSEAQIEELFDQLPDDATVDLDTVLAEIAGDDNLLRAEYKKILSDATKDEFIIWDNNPVTGKGEKFVRITGPGFMFSRWDNLVHEVCFGKYRSWILFVLLVLSLYFAKEISYVQSQFVK